MTRTTLIALSLSLALAGCAQKAEETAAETAIEAATGGDAEVDIADGKTQITVQTDQGEATMSAGENLALPADFPTDIALASARNVVSVYQAEGATVLSYTTAGKLADLVAEQDAAMKAQGWSQAMSMNSDANNAMRMFNKDGRDTMLTYSDDGAGTVTVSVQVAPKQ